MPTRCWIAPEIPTATYIFGATVWPELPTWRSMGSQPASQMGRDAASSAPSASASFCTIGMLSASLMPRPTETMISAALRSTARCDSRNSSSGLVRISRGGKLRRERLDRRGACGELVGAERPGLQRGEVRRVACEADVGVHLALEELAHQHQLRRFRRDAPTTSLTATVPSAVASLGRKSRTW